MAICCGIAYGPGMARNENLTPVFQRQVMKQLRGYSGPCGICGETFTSIRCDAQYCSQKCRSVASERDQAERQKEQEGS